MLISQEPETCPLCSGNLEPHQDRLTLHGPQMLELQLETLACENCEARYQPFGIVAALQGFVKKHANFALEEVASFKLNGEPLELSLQPNPGSDMDWDSYRTRVKTLNELKNRPLPSDEILRALPQREHTWELGGAAVGWFESTEEAEPQPAYVYLVLDTHAGIRASHSEAGSADIATLLELTKRALVYPSDEGGAYRPAALHLKDKMFLAGLESPLAALGIPVRVTDTPALDEALLSIMSEMSGSSPWLQNYTSEELKATMKAGKRFLKLEPWERFSPNKYIAYSVDGGTWAYLNVMGQNGEEYGLSMFDSWLQVCRFMHNRATFHSMLFNPDPAPELTAIGGSLESFSLVSRYNLHLQDALYLEQLELRPDAEGRYPLPLRLNSEEPELPRNPERAWQNNPKKLERFHEEKGINAYLETLLLPSRDAKFDDLNKGTRGET